LDFILNRNVLIPRPETEFLTEKTICNLKNLFCHPTLDAGSRKRSFSLDSRFRGNDKVMVIDVGTGSGNIIISIIKNIPEKVQKKIVFYAVDISKEALKVAKINAKKHKVHKKINFIQSDLLGYFLKNKLKFKNIFIIANLPYVSPKLYKKNKNNLHCEPKEALISSNRGLSHYTRLFWEIYKKCYGLRVTCFVEFSPEQKPEIYQIIRKIWPRAKTKFFKDLAGKWRIAVILIPLSGRRIPK